MITSTQNPKVKWIRDLQAKSRKRRQENAFVVEGVRMVEEAMAAGWEALLVLYTDDLTQRGQDALGRISLTNTPSEQVSARVMKAVSATETPQGILAVLPWQPLPLPAEMDFILVIDGLRDPGNLGTVLRTAYAVAVDCMILAPGTVDPLSPKVVRAGMGAHFHLPIYSMSWDDIQALLAPLRTYLADVKAGLLYSLADFRSPLALILGGEAEGAGQQAKRLATENIRIPMSGGSNSLNAAVAAAVLMYEVVRQRSKIDIPKSTIRSKPI
jgi:TrmH family RNA methyltransferase